MEQPDLTTVRPAIQKTCRCWYSELHTWKLYTTTENKGILALFYLSVQHFLPNGLIQKPGNLTQHTGTFSVAESLWQEEVFTENK